VSGVGDETLLGDRYRAVIVDLLAEEQGIDPRLMLTELSRLYLAGLGAGGTDGDDTIGGDPRPGGDRRPARR
jgi:hypothetical protein